MIALALLVAVLVTAVNVWLTFLADKRARRCVTTDLLHTAQRCPRRATRLITGVGLGFGLRVCDPHADSLIREHALHDQPI